MILETALLCLAANIYHEARGEPIPGQYAVALVTMNRAKGQGEKVCHETFKPYQFSWTSDVVRAAKGWRLPQHMLPRDSESWARALTIARVTLEGRMHDITGGATFYHAPHAAPKRWMRVMVPTKRIGAHQFYRQPT